MLSTCWQQRLSRIQQRLLLYPAPEPLLRSRSFWLATGLVLLAVLAFSIFFISYLTSLQNAYLTHAEDLGNMDQAIWSVLRPIHVPVQIIILLIDKHGREYFVSTDVPSVFWCPT